MVPFAICRKHQNQPIFTPHYFTDQTGQKIAYFCFGGSSFVVIPLVVVVKHWLIIEMEKGLLNFILYCLQNPMLAMIRYPFSDEGDCTEIYP
jgi:hypothetical protein